MGTLQDMISFETGPLAAWVAIEGASIAGGGTIAIVTSPAPFPITEAHCLELPQNSSINLYTGKTDNMTEGDAFLVMCYIRLTRAGGSNYDNDIPFLTLTDGSADHITFRLTKNGAVNDLEIVDNAGAVCHTIAGVVITEGSWRLVRALVKLDGTTGACELEIVNPDNGDVIKSGSCSGENFYSGSANCGMRFKSEGPPGTPFDPTTVHIGSGILFKGMTTPLDTDEFLTKQLGNYTCFGASPTKASAVSDVDSSGTAGGDDLENDTMWDDGGEGTVGNKCTYTTVGHNGGVKVDHPGSDSAVPTGATIYGMEWVYWLNPGKAPNNLDVFYGKETDVGYIVLLDTSPPNGVAVAHKAVEDVTGDRVPELDKDAVIGFKKTAGTGALSMAEGWAIGCYAYPLAERGISDGAVYAHRGRVLPSHSPGRIVVA